MSPEQWEAQADIDTRADVYALGVMLYRLLVGALPFEWKDGDGWRPFLKNLSVNDPPTPSTRFASLGAGGEKSPNCDAPNPKNCAATSVGNSTGS